MTTTCSEQVSSNQAIALREYEEANRVYMTTSVFTEAGKLAKQNLAAAREKYVAAVKAANPEWTVF